MSKTQQSRKENTVEKLLDRKEEEWKQNYIQNSENNHGGEVEDLTLIEETLEPASNQEAEQIIENISNSRETELKTQEQKEGKTTILGAKIKDSQLAENKEDFKPEIDTDFSPHQSEIATEVVQNPADLIYSVEKWRTLRDENLPEELISIAAGTSPGMMAFNYEGRFNVEDFLSGDVEFDEDYRRPKPRYLGFIDADGDHFFAMGAPASTQLNSGTPASSRQEVDDLFKNLFNGKDTLSILDITQGVSTLFDADPIVKDGEKVVESGRDLIYDLFVAESNAVERNENDTRWEEELGKAVPTNENYGYLKSVTENVESVRDYQELVIDTPAKLGPVTNSEYIESDFEINEDTWFVVDQEKEKGKTLREIAEQETSLSAKVLKNGEMQDVKINYGEMSEEDFEKHIDTFFSVQNSMFRPDVAPKENGVVEVRNFSNSPRAPTALVTQKALLANYDSVRAAFEEKGLENEIAEEVRHDFVVNGLNADLPDNTPMQDFYEEDLLPALVEGVRSSFSEEELPYTLERTLVYEDLDSEEELENYLSSFNGLSDFVDYQIQLDNQTDYKSGNLDFENYRSENDVFADWFTEEYESQMRTYLDEPTVNEQLHEEIEENGVQKTYRKFARNSLD